MPELATHMFTQESWKTEELSAHLTEEFLSRNVAISHVSFEHEMYPLALEKVFSFMSLNANGRYSDRTMMSIRRSADRWKDTNVSARFDYIREGHGSNLPYMFFVESPFSWDEETEIKRGGILGAVICLPNDEGEYRGIISVAEHSRNKGLGRALLTCQQNWFGTINWYAHQGNTNAMRLAASVGLGPIQVNSSTNTVQYARVELQIARRRGM